MFLCVIDTSLQDSYDSMCYAVSTDHILPDVVIPWSLMAQHSDTCYHRPRYHIHTHTFPSLCYGSSLTHLCLLSAQVTVKINRTISSDLLETYRMHLRIN